MTMHMRRYWSSTFTPYVTGSAPLEKHNRAHAGVTCVSAIAVSYSMSVSTDGHEGSAGRCGLAQPREQN